MTQIDAEGEYSPACQALLRQLRELSSQTTKEIVKID